MWIPMAPTSAEIAGPLRPSNPYYKKQQASQRLAIIFWVLIFFFLLLCLYNCKRIGQNLGNASKRDGWLPTAAATSHFSFSCPHPLILCITSRKIHTQNVLHER
jgi:hypothetical protein